MCVGSRFRNFRNSATMWQTFRLTFSELVASAHTYRTVPLINNGRVFFLICMGFIFEIFESIKN